jgi:hypothetical protein
MEMKQFAIMLDAVRPKTSSEISTRMTALSGDIHNVVKILNGK